MDIEKDSYSLVINIFQFLIYIQSPKTASLHFRQHLYDNAEGSENYILTIFYTLGDIGSKKWTHTSTGNNQNVIKEISPKL